MYNNMERGFTLIELVISIFILSVALIGVYSAFSIVTVLTSDSADRLTATYLTQEGMEIVRNIRDTNWLNMDTPPNGTTPSWLDGFSSCKETSGGCEADYTYTSMMPYNNVDYLNLDSNGFYKYTGVTCPGSPSCTKFQRKIIVTPIVDIDGNTTLYHIIDVKVQVSWDQKATIVNNSTNPPLKANICGSSNCITAEGTLYNWYNQPSSGKDITSFNFGYGDQETDDPIIPATPGTPGTIRISLPNGTDLTTLTATFENSFGSIVKVGNYQQFSGILTDYPGKQKDFSNSSVNPITYTVFAQDGTSQDYKVYVSDK